MKKIWENLFSSGGKRFLICLIMGILGLALSAVFPPAAIIGGPIGFFGIFGAFSIIGKQKTYLMGGFSVTGKDGKVINCAVIKQKHHAYMPFIPIVCPFYYIPFKTVYHIVRNVTAPKVSDPLRINNNILGSQVLDSEPITEEKYKRMISHPESFADEIQKSTELAREKYYRDIAPYFETGILNEIYHTDEVSVCRTSLGSHLLFHYDHLDDDLYGIHITEELLESLKSEPNCLFAAYIEAPEILENLRVKLDETIMERILNDKEYKEHVDTEASKKTMADINENKTPITKEMITADLKWKCLTRNVLFSILWGFFAALFIVCGFFAGIFGIIVFTIIIGGILVYATVTHISDFTKYKRTLSSTKYKIIKAPCVDVEVHEDSEGGTYETAVFANGEKLTSISCSVGDYLYFLYLEGETSAKNHYDGKKFIPAPDIYVETFIMK